MEISKALTTMLLFVFSVVFFVIINENIASVDTSAWTFVGAAFVISFLPIVPWLFLVGSLSIPIYLLVKT
jgi:hypothetical protein